MRNHTTPRIHELSGPAGKLVPITPGNGTGTATFLLNALPVGKSGKFWYYTQAIWVKINAHVATGNAPLGGLGNITQSLLWGIMQSVQVQCPILGTLYTHANTPGSVLGNLIQYMGMGYNALPSQDPVPLQGGSQDVSMYFRIPFSNEFLRKPHETSPWAGFLEGGTLEVKTNPGNFLAPLTNNPVSSVVTVKAWMELIPSPEPVIHTPCHWRLHTTPGGSSRHTITDMGSPDGLQGIDQSKGAGISALMGISNINNLGGSGAVSNIIGYDFPFRDQARSDNPDALMASLIVAMGNNRRPMVTNSLIAHNDSVGFPFDDAHGMITGELMSPRAMVFPVVAPGRDQETSKFQTVAGAKELNFQYTAVPSGQSLWLGQYFPQFDEQFAQTLAARIAPNTAGELVSKTLNKQAGGIRGVGKLAYTRQKIKS